MRGKESGRQAPSSTSDVNGLRDDIAMIQSRLETKYLILGAMNYYCYYYTTTITAYMGCYHYHSVYMSPCKGSWFKKGKKLPVVGPLQIHSPVLLELSNNCENEGGSFHSLLLHLAISVC